MAASISGNFSFRIEERPHGRDGESLAAGGLHAREGKQAGHLTGAAYEQLHWSAALPTHVNFTFEDEDHAIGGLAFFEEDVAGLRDDLFAMLREPQAIFKRQALQGADTIECSRDGFSGCRTGRRGQGRGKHPEPPA